jgi:hypothetical protein
MLHDIYRRSALLGDTSEGDTSSNATAGISRTARAEYNIRLVDHFYVSFSACFLNVP